MSERVVNLSMGLCGFLVVEVYAKFWGYVNVPEGIE